MKSMPARRSEQAASGPRGADCGPREAELRTTRARFRWALPLLRYGLLIAAVAWLIYRVDWYDHVRLNDGGRVRLLEQRSDGFVIEGQREPLSPDQVQYETDRAGRRAPVIELGIASVARRVDLRLTLWAVLLFLPSVLLQSYRLVVMVATQGMRLSFWSATKLTFAGNIFNFVLPSTVGGDVVKAYYITRYTHRKTEVVTIVFIDRVIGLIGMIILAAVGILATFDVARFWRELSALGILCASLAVATVVVFNRRVRRALRLPQIVAALPKSQHLLRIGTATVGLWHHKLRVAAALLLTLVLQGGVMISAAFIAWALNMRPGWSFAGLGYYCTYVSIGFLIAAIPITPPQAFGVMEAAYVQFFTQGGLNDASQAVALALGVRFIQLVWALPGLLVPLLGAHLPNKAELAALDAAAADDSSAAAVQAGSGAPAVSPAPATPTATGK